MDLRQFWMTWRRDIVRGAVLFAVILTAGLTISNLVGRARRGFHLNFDGPDAPELAGPAAPGDTAAVWTWTGKVAPQQSVWLKNVNGDVAVEPAVGDSVAVVVKKSGRRSQLRGVRLVAVPGDGVTICALWQSGRRHCGAEGDDEAGSRPSRTPRRGAPPLAAWVARIFPGRGAEGPRPRRFRGTVGTGGRTILVETLHGSIQVRKLAPQAPPAPKAPARPAPAAPRATS